MSANSPMDHLAVVDSGTLDRLREWGGDALVDKLIGLFLEVGPQRLSQIRDGVKRPVLGEAEQGAHSLKSSAGNLGAVRLQALAQQMEDLAGSGDESGARDLLPELESSFEEASASLSQLRSASPG